MANEVSIEIAMPNSSEQNMDDNITSLLNQGFQQFTGEGRQYEVPVHGTIHVVPSSYRHGNEKAYSPKFVSIGPYHYKGNELLCMNESIKLKYVMDLTNRRPDKPLRSYVAVVNSFVSVARKEYSGDKEEISDEEFAKMLVTDGCFIIELLIKWFVKDRKTQLNDVMANLPTLRNDLLLMENQIPFFILEELFKNFNVDTTVNGNNAYYFAPSITFIEIALAFFMENNQNAKFAAKEINKNRRYDQFDHILHVYHTSLSTDFQKITRLETIICNGLIVIVFAPFTILIPFFLVLFIHLGLLLLCWLALAYSLTWCYSKLIKLDLQQSSVSSNPSNPFTYDGHNLAFWIPNACYLQGMDFTFKKKYANKHEFMNVTLNWNRIEIPALLIDENLFSHFKNQRYGINFSAFAKLIDFLLQTTEDVAILKESGIISNREMDNQGVVDFFNNLSKNTHFVTNDETYLDPFYRHVKVHYHKRRQWPNFYEWRKRYMTGYFTNPWVVPSVLAALLLFTFASVQTFFTVYPYYHPRT